MVPDGDTTNTVGIFGVDRLGRILNPTDTADVTTFDPSIALTKTVSDDLVQTGSTVTYTFTATNTGDDPLTDIVLDDDQCANRVLVDDGNGDAILDPAEVWTWTCDTAITVGDGEPRDGDRARPHRRRRRRLPARDRRHL